MLKIGKYTLSKDKKILTEEFFVGKEQIFIEVFDDCNLKKFDAVIIEDSQNNEFSKVCEVLTTIKKNRIVPIWVLTNAKLHEKETYLRLGANGLSQTYRELSLLVSNYFSSIEHSSFNALEKKIFINELKRCVLVDNREYYLTNLEFKVLHLLYNCPNKVITYSDFCKKIWKSENDMTNKYRTANVIYHLRSKIEENIKKPEFIKTIRGKGYFLEL